MHSSARVSQLCVVHESIISRDVFHSGITNSLISNIYMYVCTMTHGLSLMTSMGKSKLTSQKQSHELGRVNRNGY